MTFAKRNNVNSNYIKERILYIKDINNGFSTYPYEIVEGNKEYLYKIIERFIEINGYENTYVDFYYSKLTKESKEIINNNLVSEEKRYLVNMNIKEDEIYFNLNKELFNILFKLTTNEILFSTFYFTKYKCSIWGNYNLRFPIFFKDENIKSYYKYILKKY